MLPALSDWVQPQGAISEYDPFSTDAMEGRPYPEAKRGGFTDPETGYGFRMRHEEFSRDDLADAMASDRLRWAQQDQEDWRGSS